jgi:glyoxylase-like metal-dependent hydrolase (beta-lactamase superfamily II)
VASRTKGLTWDVFVAPELPVVSDDLPPDLTQRTWAPVSATLISGEKEAVLVDALLTSDQALALASWVAASGRDLTTIYITHGHGDHFFGLGPLLYCFPHAQAFATPAVISHMREQSASNLVETYWNVLLPGQIPQHLVIAEPLVDGVIDLEGHDLVVIEVGHTDTDNTTCLHVPAIDLVVAGDTVYSDVHLFLSESDTKGRQEWLAALDVIEALRPSALVAGHKRLGREDSPRSIEETRKYLQDFDRADRATRTAQDLYSEVVTLYPSRVSPGTLWGSAQAVKSSATSDHGQSSLSDDESTRRLADPKR